MQKDQTVGGVDETITSVGSVQSHCQDLCPSTHAQRPLSGHKAESVNAMSITHADYPPELSAEEEHYLLSNLKDWSIAHGLAVRPGPAFVQPSQDPSGTLAATAPVTLFPSIFPRSCFDEGLAIQTAYNKLYSAIANDEEWLQSIVEELLHVDDFVAKLWQTHLEVKKAGYVQDLSLIHI